MEMKPVRQIAAVDVEIATNNMTVNDTKALLAATSADQLVYGTKRKVAIGLTASQIARMEKRWGTCGERLSRLRKPTASIT